MICVIGRYITSAILYALHNILYEIGTQPYKIFGLKPYKIFGVNFNDENIYEEKEIEKTYICKKKKIIKILIQVDLYYL